MKLSTKRNAIASALALTGLFMFGGPVEADTVKAKFLSSASILPLSGGLFVWERSTTVDANNDSPLTLRPNTNLPLGGSGGTPAADFIALCMETGENIADGQEVSYTVAELANGPVDNSPGPNLAPSPMGPNKALDMKRLFGGVYPTFGGSIAGVAVGGVGFANLVAALQLSVWEIINENKVGSSPGGFSYSTTAGNYANFAGNATQKTIANGWLGQLGTYTDAVGLKALVLDGKQDMIVQAVPIPAAAWLFGSAILGTVALGRRKLKEGAEA